MSLRSALPGRERWSVAGLIGRREEAREVESRLSASGEVQRASASGVTGSVLVEFDPGTQSMRIRSLVASVVQSVFEEERPASIAVRDRELPGEALFRMMKPHRATFFAASLFTVIEGILEVATPLILLFGVNTLTGGAGALLASWGFGTVLSQVVLIGAALAASASAAWIAHEASTTLWSRLASGVSHDLSGFATDTELLLVEEFWSEGAGGIIGFPVSAGAAAGATSVIARRSALIVLVPAAVLAFVAITRPRRIEHREGEHPLVHALRGWLQPRHLFAIGAVAAGVLIAWLAGWISLEIAGMLLILGEMTLAPATTIGHHLLALSDATGVARQLSTRNERKVLAISSGE